MSIKPTIFKRSKIILLGAFLCLGLWGLWFQYDHFKISQHFRPTKGEMIHPRAGHQAILLKDGRVLIIGGNRLQEDGAGILEPVLEAELYDPNTETYSPAGKMHFFHKEGTSTLLQDGKVLLVGGRGNKPYQCPYNYKTSEIFDPLKKQFLPVGSMNTPRLGHGATLLPDGKVLITAGSEYLCLTKNRNISDVGPYLSSQEVFDPKTGQFSLTKNLQTGHSEPQILPFSQSEILIAGRAINGLTPEKDERKDIEIYNFATQKSRYFDISPLAIKTTKLYAVNHHAIVAVMGEGSPNRYYFKLYSLNRQKNKFERQFFSKTPLHGFSSEIVALSDENVFLVLNYLPAFLDSLPSSHAFHYDFKTHHLQDIGDYPRGPVYEVPIVSLKSGQVLLTGGACRTKCTNNKHFSWLYLP